jgi:hypothetical protein
VIADTGTVAAAMTQLEGDADAAGWDQTPTLWAFHVEPITDGLSALTVGPFPGFDTAVGFTGHSFHALTALRQALSLSGPQTRPDTTGLTALALMDEAWMVKQQPGQPHPTGSFAEHPDRVEQRFVLLVAVDGSTRLLTRVRGEDTTSTAGEMNRGRLAEALTGLLHQCLHPETVL